MAEITTINTWINYTMKTSPNGTDNKIQFLNKGNLEQFYSLILTAIMSSFIAMLDLVCVLFLMKSTKLQKSKFHFLTLCLSIGDFLTLMFTVILLTNSALERFDTHVSYLCTISSSLVYSSVLFSLFQTLTICIERYFATSTSNVMPVNISRMMLKKALMVLLFGICLLYTILILVGNGFSFSTGCLGNVYSTVYTYWKEIPIILLLVSIIIIYLIVIYRLKQMLTKVSVAHENMSDFQFDRRVRRLKMNIFTLGLILLVLAFGTMPRIIIAFKGAAQSGNVGNIFLMLPPLINPFIYVLRFMEFRKMCKPRCCQRPTENSVTMESTQNTVC